MTVFDTHVHLWDPAARGPHPAFDGRAERLLALMDANAVDRALVVLTHWDDHEHNHALDAVAAHRDRLVLMGWIADPSAPGALAELERWQARGARGWRTHLMTDGAWAAFRSDRVDPVLRAATDARLPMQLMYRDRAADVVVAEVAARHPDLMIVIDHLGHLGPAPAAWTGVLALAKHGNVRVKLSLHGELSNESFPWTDLHPLQERLVDVFGPERLLWGSNFPMHLGDDAEYGQRLAAVAEHLPFLTGSERAAVLAGNGVFDG